MSTLEGAVPLGLGITKLRLWDELHRAHCETFPHSHRSPPLSGSKTESALQATKSPQHGGAGLEFQKNATSSMPQPIPGSSSASPASGTKRRPIDASEASLAVSDAAREEGSRPCMEHDFRSGPHSSFSDWFLSPRRRNSFTETDLPASTLSAEPGTDAQGVLMPPPPAKPGPSRRKPPPLVARIKAKARRAKRKQQKAEYRRRLFLAHMVQGTKQARQQHAISSTPSAKTSGAASTSDHSKTSGINHARALFPEGLGVDVGTFVEIVFDTDAQSSEVTAPSDISDDDLASATRTEIETRKRLEGADIVVPSGVFRWMVARDFAERWPQKVQGVRKNPWPGVEDVWGLPSDVGPGERAYTESSTMKDQVGREQEPMRWQSGRRSRFIRRKGKGMQTRQRALRASSAHSAASNTSGEASLPSSSRSGSALPSVSLTGSSQSAATDLLLSQSNITANSRPVVQSDWQSVAGPFDARHAGRSSEGMLISKASSDRLDSSVWLSASTFDCSDWSSAVSCSHAAALPNAVAGLPILL